ncbi:HNH endonuclease signature motif containing protein [Algoriphagus sp.]|uniref:HNH endonuclease signature motif containing protein n=1 Tax=Algoriphagus sp. TaxID=1872435 RepID=UPI00271F6078|nr:HNH endonuclease signature motif containing protein [Algoriphagus sp.]MDO8967179.1 HNH endonuclease signature motif containing protein [Algoriphagus sp.]MDP3198323.1 HNH endonuclease signature motif containing protein [Algoriphagus sp.]
MRPLNKGNTPTDAAGNAIVVSAYRDWRSRLINRIGYYCVYCNQPLSHSLQVEHVIPKNPPKGVSPGPALDWDNMLLACGPCNNAKDNTPIDANTYYLPEEHNTHLPFSIVLNANPDHAIVIERPGLNANQHHKAHDTIELLALDNIDERPAIVDIRSIKRKAAILSVKSARQVYDMALASTTYNANVVAIDIARRAADSGFFSLWYEEFFNEPLIMEKLTDNSIIKGTATNCFDSNMGYIPIPRNPLNPSDPI